MPGILLNEGMVLTFNLFLVDSAKKWAEDKKFNFKFRPILYIYEIEDEDYQVDFFEELNKMVKETEEKNIFIFLPYLTLLQGMLVYKVIQEVKKENQDKNIFICLPIERNNQVKIIGID